MRQNVKISALYLNAMKTGDIDMISEMRKVERRDM